MVREAQLRQEYNKKRRQFKQMLNTASAGASTVTTKDLMLAAKIAKMELPPMMLNDTTFCAEMDHRAKTPSKITWKPFYQAVEYPALRGAGSFPQHELPTLRRNQVTKSEEGTVEVVHETKAEVEVDEEVVKYFEILRAKMTDRFAQLRRAFRTIDEDASGTLDADEVRQILHTFNLGIPDHVLDKIIRLADFDGDGSINYAEFARIMTTEDVTKMKNTLQAAGSAVNAAKIRRQMAQGHGNQMSGVVSDENVKLRRTGPGLDKLRKAHSTLRKAILSRYASVAEAFRDIDSDGSGLIRRNELRKFLRTLSKSIPDNVISALIDYVDIDQDIKTLTMQEFVAMFEAEVLA